MRPTIKRTPTRERRNKRIAIAVIAAMVLMVAAPVLFFFFPEGTERDGADDDLEPPGQRRAGDKPALSQENPTFIDTNSRVGLSDKR